MFDNIGYQFSNLDELLIFVEWLTANFEKPEDFEEYLVEKMPFLADADDSTIAITTIDAVCLMDNIDDEDFIEEDLQFWEIINNEYHNEELDGPAIPGSD
jgi:hypothetical protein